MLDILSNEFNMAAEECADTDDEKEMAFNSGEMNCARRVTRFVKELNALDVPSITGETSDGYHTFNELYHHRAVLFSVIVKAFPDRAWKSRKHHDGTMYDGMFIVGIETPDGQATYHYDIEPYWDMFECKELEYAPEWDGHTPAQAIARIGKLEPVPVVRCKECVCSSRLDDQLVCSRISEVMDGYYHGTVDVVKPDDYCSHGIHETAKPIDVKMGAE